MGNSFCSFTFSQLVGRQLYYLFVNLILEMAQSCQPGFLNDEVEQNPFFTSLLPNPGYLKLLQESKEKFQLHLRYMNFSLLTGTRTWTTGSNTTM